MGAGRRSLRRRRVTSQTHLPGVLACLYGTSEFRRNQLRRLHPVPATYVDGVFTDHAVGTGLSRAGTAWLWAACAGRTGSGFGTCRKIPFRERRWIVFRNGAIARRGTLESLAEQ